MKNKIYKYFKKNIISFIVIAMFFSLAISSNFIQGRDAVKASIQNEGSREISAQQAISVIINEKDEMKVIYEKNCDEKAYPASITKIMTSLVVLETLEELHSPIEQLVEVPNCAVGAEGSSIYLKNNEKISIEDLIYGMMLRSGNDAAIALANIIGGDVEGFVEKMNKRALELGCSGTHFTNPNGLFDENHYTTARDMVMIAAEAMKNDEFRKISSAREYNAQRKDSEYCYFYNKNKTVHQYDGGNGIKIGFTKKSGRTLVASAERDGKLAICVVMNAPDWFNDAYYLMDKCFEK